MKTFFAIVGLVFTINGMAEYNSYTTSNPAVDAIKASLEQYRDKLTGSELDTLKTAINKYLAAYGEANEKVNTARAGVKKLGETDIPALEAKMKPLKEKEDAYLAGTLREEDFSKIKTELDSVKRMLADARAALIKQQSELTATDTAFNKAQQDLTGARAPIKAAEDKMLGAMAQALSTMTLQQNMDQLKLEGLTAAHKLEIIEAQLADTVLEGYVRAKMGRFLVSPEFCRGVSKCSSSYGTPPNPELKDVFPGKKPTTHK